MLLAPFPRSCASPRASRSNGSASRCEPARSSPRSTPRASRVGRRADRARRRCCGRRAWRRRRWPRRSACRSIAPAASLAEPTLAVPGHPEIFVVGDICALQQDGKPLPGVAQVAMQQGAHAARNVLRAIRGDAARAVPLSRLRQHGDDRPRLGGRRHRLVQVSGFLAWLIWLFIHIFSLIGFRNRLAVMGEWAWAYSDIPAPRATDHRREDCRRRAKSRAVHDRRAADQAVASSPFAQAVEPPSDVAELVMIPG